MSSYSPEERRIATEIYDLRLSYAFMDGKPEALQRLKQLELQYHKAADSRMSPVERNDERILQLLKKEEKEEHEKETKLLP